MCFRCWEKGGAGRALCGTAGFGEGTTELDREQGERVTLGRRREPGFPCGSGLSREPLAPPPAAQELAAEAAPTSDRGRCTRGRLLDSGDVFSTDCPHAHALSRDRTLRHRQARSRQPPHAPLRAVRQSRGDRKSVVQGQRVYVRVDLGGRRNYKKNKKK